jgi:NAD(P)-dependent dehydrogenase (short-subunit alcohol dehydrogenase family)
MTAKVAVVTGCSSGFGLLTTLELARRGFRVFATLRNPASAERLDAALAEAKLTAEKVQLDVTDSGSIQRMVAEVTRAAGHIDVLVNNAGISMGGLVEDSTMKEIRTLFETNFFGTVELTKQVLPAMRERREGRVICVSSLSGYIGFPGFGGYCGSKFALEGLCESLRHEMRPHNVFVSLVLPGVFRTEIFEKNKHVAAQSTQPGSSNPKLTEAITRNLMGHLERSRADPRAVALTIAKAATARRPALRYIVGADARLGAFLYGLFPARLWESAVGVTLRGGKREGSATP